MQDRTWRGLPTRMRQNPAASPHTDGLIVVDQWGNMAVVNHTINTMLWGKTGLFIDGISIPDSAAMVRVDVEEIRGKQIRVLVGCPTFIRWRFSAVHENNATLLNRQSIPNRPESDWEKLDEVVRIIEGIDGPLNGGVKSGKRAEFSDSNFIPLPPLAQIQELLSPE